MTGAAAAAEGIDDTKEPQAGISSVVRRVFGGDNNALTVKGQGDLLVYRARCCNPIRGEAIVGYVTRGKGVAVEDVATRFGAYGTGPSLYLRDPDGFKVELKPR